MLTDCHMQRPPSPAAGRFWTGLENKYGVTKFYRKNGQDEAVLRTVEDILDGLTNSDQLGTSVL